MQIQPNPDLEKFVHQALQQLPELEAPQSLVPRVMAVIRSRAALPWWQQAWWNWPWAAKIAFVALALTFVAMLGGGGWWLDNGVTTYSQQMTEQMAPLARLWESLPSLQSLLAGLQAKASPSLIFYGLGVAGVMYLACVGVGTICYRFALKRF